MLSFKPCLVFFVCVLLLLMISGSLFSCNGLVFKLQLKDVLHWLYERSLPQPPHTSLLRQLSRKVRPMELASKASVDCLTVPCRLFDFQLDQPMSRDACRLLVTLRFCLLCCCYFCLISSLPKRFPDVHPATLIVFEREADRKWRGKEKNGEASTR